MTAISNIPFGEPSKLTAGDTWEWRRALGSLYPPSDGWVLTYALRGVGNINLTATASGSDHLIQVSAAVTADYAPGDYRWSALVTKAGERHLVGNGFLQVLPNLAAITDGSYEFRSPTKIALDAIEAVLQHRATLDQQAYTIGGRSLTRTPIKELLLLRDRFRAEYQVELDAEGGGRDRNLYVQFQRP